MSERQTKAGNLEVFSWEPALETQNSRAEEDDVKKKALQFSAINSDF